MLERLTLISLLLESELLNSSILKSESSEPAADMSCLTLEIGDRYSEEIC
jgi:hypothetical protein